MVVDVTLGIPSLDPQPNHEAKEAVECLGAPCERCVQYPLCNCDARSLEQSCHPMLMARSGQDLERHMIQHRNPSKKSCHSLWRVVPKVAEVQVLPGRGNDLLFCHLIVWPQRLRVLCIVRDSKKG